MTGETIATALGGRKAGGAWMTRCPAHDDRKPSLSIRDGDDGRVLARCHAGCEQERVIAALLSRSLWQEMRDAQGRPSGPFGCALDRIAREERTCRNQPVDPSARRSIYDGQERLGDIQQSGGEFVARDRSGQVIGRYDSAADAINVVCERARAAARGAS
jgi:hypothetical protein